MCVLWSCNKKSLVTQNFGVVKWFESSRWTYQNTRRRWADRVGGEPQGAPFFSLFSATACLHPASCLLTKAVPLSSFELSFSIHCSCIMHCNATRLEFYSNHSSFSCPSLLIQTIITNSSSHSASIPYSKQQTLTNLHHTPTSPPNKQILEQDVRQGNA